MRAAEISDQGLTVASEQLRHTGVMFIGFAAAFAAISFAIARILGEFRQGGGDVQETIGDEVQTLRMPLTAKAFLAIMVVGMTTILAGVVGNFIVAAGLDGRNLQDSEQLFIWLEGVRRIGVATYLFAILLGLATIVTVLRFQAVRIRTPASSHRRA